MIVKLVTGITADHQAETKWFFGGNSHAAVTVYSSTKFRMFGVYCIAFKISKSI
jgi:hypothetical protein